MYIPKTKPFSHQASELDFSCELDIRGILWEQGTGKSWLGANTAGWLAYNGKIDGLLVLAPKGIHYNWVAEELPRHLPQSLIEDSTVLCYQTARSKTKWHQRAVERCIKAKGFAVLAISYDALMTDAGRNAVWKFLRHRRCLYIADESARIKSPSAKRSIRSVKSAVYAPYRRILTGTPVANSPFDLYMQLKFLDEGFWHRHGISNFYGFKTTFGIWERKYNSKQDREYDELIDYRDLPRLKQILDSIATRVTKDEVLDLPPKLYELVRFELSPKQQRLYDEIRNEFITFLDSGEMVTAPLAIVRLLRLQQITCGYLPTDDDKDRLVPIEEKHPRIELLKELTEDLSHPAIIWARFRRDIDQIMEVLGERAVRYDGKVDEDGRIAALQRFTSGRAQFFVSNPSVGGEGLTLNQARTVIYYSNNFKLVERQQSEDRAHRIGQEHPVNYIDLIAQNTVDEHILNALRTKFDLARRITGDEMRTWL